MKKLSTDLNKFRDQFVRETLRRASFRWPPRGEALKASRVKQDVNPKTGHICWFHKCATCSKLYVSKEVRLDHVNPVVPIEGMSELQASIPSTEDDTGLHLGSFVRRMFPEAAGYQVLCTSCHSAKTKSESAARAKARRARKGTNGSKG